MVTNTAILSIPLFIDFALNGFIFRTFFPQKIKALVACLFILLPSVWLKYIYMVKEFWFNTEEFLEYFKQKQLKIYEEDRIYKFLNEGLGPDPVVIMADPYSGPRILYSTKHRVVAVPFHSQRNGVIYSLTITIKPQAEEKETREILKTTNSSYVFVNKAMCNCPELSINLANFIIHGQIPQWLESVQLPISNDNFILTKILRDKL
jgi:hypothetical protein